MNEKLQQAITATRNGQVKEAQLLLTQVLKDDPNEAQAWFLLSNLVDSEPKKVAYLGKVLALNPQHEMAQKMLSRLRGAEVEVEETAVSEIQEEDDLATAVADEIVMPEALDMEDAALIADLDGEDILATADEMPDWLIEEDLATSEKDILAEAEGSDEAETEATTEDAAEAAIPDWLLEETADDEETAVEKLAAVEAEDAESAALVEGEDGPEIVETVQETAVAPLDDRQKQYASLTRILYLLLAVTAVTLVVFLYLVFTAL